MATRPASSACCCSMPCWIVSGSPVTPADTVSPRPASAHCRTSAWMSTVRPGAAATSLDPVPTGPNGVHTSPVLSPRLSPRPCSNASGSNGLHRARAPAHRNGPFRTARALRRHRRSPHPPSVIHRLQRVVGSSRRASRSGCRPPSIVLALPCRLKLSSRSSAATVGADTLWPRPMSSSAGWRRLLVVHRSGRHRVATRPGSTRATSAAFTPGSVLVTLLRPPSTCRVRPSGSPPARSPRQ